MPRRPPVRPAIAELEARQTRTLVAAELELIGRQRQKLGAVSPKPG